MMEVKITQQMDFSTAFIQGDIDHHTAKNIREKIDRYVKEKQPKLLKLDFSKVQFMDSSGIGLIMGRYKLMKLLNGSVRVINMPENIKRLIKLSGLLSLGVVEESEF